MAKGFDRRRFLGGGCALFAVGCSGDGDVVPTPDHSGASTGPTGETGGTDAVVYPCGQTEVPDGSFTELTLAEYPDLAEPGGWYAGAFGGRNVVVAHVTEGCYAAVLAACTHEGALVDYRPERQGFVCPRHGALYGPDGGKISGPQPTGLQNFPCVRVGDSVFVQVS